MSIRKANEKDYKSIKALINQGQDLHIKSRPDIYKKGNVLSKEYFEQILNQESTLTIVYEENGKIYGYLFANVLTNANLPIMRKRKILYIDTLVVDENARRKGIGNCLMHYAEQFAKDNKINSIELNVLNFNKNAIKFYENFGMTCKSIRMEKILNNKKKESC